MVAKIKIITACEEKYCQNVSNKSKGDPTSSGKKATTLNEVLYQADKIIFGNDFVLRRKFHFN